MIFVVYSFNDLKCKEIINVKTGARLGYADDIEFDNCTAKICRLIVFGRAKLFGLLGREDDLFIKWCDIDVIGDDTILVSCDVPSNCIKHRSKGLGSLFK